MNPTYFSLITSPNSTLFRPEVKDIMDKVEQQIEDKAVSLSSVIQAVSREAVKTQYDLMRNSNNEAIKLKASQDFLDRNPETSKIHKHQVEQFSVSPEDSHLLATALIRAAEARAAGAGAAVGDFVRIPIEDQSDADSALTQSQVRQVNAGRTLSAEGQLVGREAAIPDLREGASKPEPAPEEPAPKGAVTIVR